MINLGDEVRDKVTGFQGIAVARHTFLHGCDRYSVQPLVNDKGELQDPNTFDGPQLEVVSSEVAPEGDKDVGGPEKYRPHDRPTGQKG